MQIQKENIHQQILEVSGKEFFQHGFKGTSMRTIAQKTGVGLSNIYNYFKNKDEILQAVLQPLLDHLATLQKGHNSVEHINTNTFYSDEYQRKNIQEFVEMVELYREELNLILFHVHGSKLEDFKEELIAGYTQTGLDYLHKMKEKYPATNSNISEFFIHNYSSQWVNVLGEIVTHNLTHEETEQFISEYIQFSTAGWKKLMRV